MIRNCFTIKLTKKMFDISPVAMENIKQITKREKKILVHLNFLSISL